MRKKIVSLALFVGATFLLAATGVLAASPAVSNSHPVLQDETTPTVTPIAVNPVAAMIATFFGLDDTQVQTWHDLGIGDGEGIGYGNMAIALFFAEASGLDFEDIMAMRGEEEGGGWGVIMRSYGLHPGNQMNLGAIMSGRVTPTPEEGSGDEVQSPSTKGPPHEPKGWQQGKGRGLGRGQNGGHGRGHNK